MPLRGPNVYGDVITQLADLQSSTAGISNIGSLKSSFGIDPNLVGNIFGGRRKSLASGRARALSSASARMSSRVASPEVKFGGIESGYADALSNLESAQGGAEYDQESKLTQLLYSILQGRDQFNLNKNQLQSQALGGQLQEKQWDASQPGALDDILGILGGAATVANPILGFLGNKAIAGALKR